MIVTVTLNPAIDRILSVPGFRTCPERRREAGRTLKCRVVAVVPAGKGVNVSRYLAALGVPSVAAGFVGARERAFYEESLAGLRPGGAGLRPGAAGTSVTPAFVSVDAPTRTNTTILAPRGGAALSALSAGSGSRSGTSSGRRSGETHLREEGFTVPPAKRDALASVLDAFAREGNTFVFAGSLPKGFPAAEFSRLIRRLRASGARVVVDASGPALRAAAAAGVDLLSPNEDELRELGLSLPRILRRVSAVAVKRGAKGGLLVTRDATFAASVKLPAGNVRNAVGAGDAFLAGFLAARTRREPDDACLRAAVAAGAAAVLSGIVGRLDPRVFRRLLSRVEAGV
jgi:fructose-1-phosphate kinase PfkB-like protein